MANVPKLVGVFALVLALVLAIAAAIPLLASPSGDANPRPQDPASFEPGTIVPQELSQNGSVSVDAGSDRKVVLIDRAHENDFDREEIEPMVDALVEQGYEVRFHGGSGPGGAPSPSAGPGSSSPLNQSLRGADAFVVISPDRPFTDAARRGVADFAERGGRVALLGEPTSQSPAIVGIFGPAPQSTAASQMTPLSSRFGMSLSTGYLYNMHENGNNFQNVYATAAGDGPLTEGVDRVLFDRATEVAVGGDASVALSATDRTALSTTRQQGGYPVAAVNGNVALIGDTSFLTPANYQYADNEVLIGNLAEFLVTGEKEPKPKPTAQRPGVPPGAGQPRPPSAGPPPTNGSTPPSTATPAAP
ncbi:DUF4350 domain-containing protein [Halorientalis pallida]|uniref:DUF4350 domain-containing protein n=1 Tax=Halorientalis pallida TaxID=2479928 RepID=A0A498KYY8_9EURY|nr:DUF4350 domain-containing protein [Halorientalis pallida]RXK51260.1 hypothetical protein EAF64_01040 [Halorientalis pallida]